MRNRITFFFLLIGLIAVGVAFYIVNKDSLNLGTDSTTDNTSQGVGLVYEISNAEITTYETNAYFTLITNKEVEIVENSRAQLFLSEKAANNKFYYVIKASSLGTGPSKFNFEITDGIDTFQITKSINRQNYSLPFGLREIPEWPDTRYTANGANLLAKVDKSHRLPQDYAPEKLVDIAKDLLLYTNSPEPYLIQEEAGQSLRIMANALQSETGKNLVITSAYRDFNSQLTIYSGWVKSLGQEEADRVSARPGYSEHQLGTVVDFVDQETGLDLTNEFDKGVAGKWLKENAHKYGFVQSYPENKSEITGYSYEAWHWRYIGIDNATELKNSGLTLKEWLNTK